MSLYLDSKYILAPLCGYTDAAYRRSCRRYGLKYSFTPLIEAGALVYANKACDDILFRAEDDEWLGVQILGSNAEMMEAGAKIIFNKYNYFDVLDLNLGCPVHKVVRKGAGAALGRNQEEAVRCLEALIKVSPIPVTAKTRIVNETDPEQTIKLAKALEATGIQALTLHGRIMEKKYSGPVFADMIKAVKNELKIPVIANGGVFNHQTAQLLHEQTSCSHLMIARGSIGNPWIFKELEDASFKYPTHEELCNEMESHISDVLDLLGEEVGIRNSRKFLLAYLRGRGYAAELRDMVSRLKNREDFLALVAKTREIGQNEDFFLRPMGRGAMEIEFA